MESTGMTTNSVGGMKQMLLLAGVFATAGATAHSQVLINEWLTSTEAPQMDFIELFNAGNTAVDLSGHFLTDDLNVWFQWQIPFGTSISARGFLAFEAEKLNFDLSAAGGNIGLFTPNGTAVDVVSYGTQQMGVSQGRFPDGDPNNFSLMSLTPGAPNSPPRFAVTLAQQPADQTVAVGGAAVITVTALGAQPITYQWRLNGAHIPGATLASYFIDAAQPADSGNYSVVVSNPSGSTTSAVARLALALVHAGSNWKYLDDGLDQGTAWRNLEFDDSNWAFGPAQLGYGDNDEATLVSFGLDPSNKYITTYFRHSFVVSNAVAYTNLSARLLRDDGAVVYLNGLEVFRSNMPGGFITYTNQALAAVVNAEETNFFISTVPAAALREGFNVLAVEIHQENPMSSDISFDIELTGSGTAMPVITKQPVSVIAFPGAFVATFFVGVNGPGPFSFQWQLNGVDLPGATDSVLTIFDGQLAQFGSYRVLVSNPSGTVASQPAQLIPDVPRMARGGRLRPESQPLRLERCHPRRQRIGQQRTGRTLSRWPIWRPVGLVQLVFDFHWHSDLRHARQRFRHAAGRLCG